MTGPSTGAGHHPAACDEQWAALYDHAYRAAERILAQGAGEPASPSARYLYRESERLAATHEYRRRPRPDGAAADALDAVAEAWPQIRAGVASGEEVIMRRGGLWRRLMNEWPMGHYAHLAAAALSTVDGPLDTVVELGAGVGATTRLARRVVAERGGRLLPTDRGYRGAMAVDFDRPLATQVPPADAVLATNALHCAADPVATLCRIREVLRPGGWLVLAEGAPEPVPGVPWALNLIFGACRDWYDRNGFRTPDFWLDALRASGLREVERTRWPSERYDFGGAFVARAR